MAGQINWHINTDGHTFHNIINKIMKQILKYNYTLIIMYMHSRVTLDIIVDWFLISTTTGLFISTSL